MKISYVVIIYLNYRTWQMGLICSLRLLSKTTVREQVEGALIVVAGDCQYVLFNVIAPLQVLIVSV
jgi:hypothetical protein